MNPEPQMLGIIAVIFLLAGMVKGVIGMGLPTLAMGLLGLLMAPAPAAALMVIPSAVTNIWQALDGAATIRLLRRLWTMLVGQIAGVLVGASLIVSGNTRLATLLLGAVLVLYAVSALANMQLPAPGNREKWLSPLAGLISGLITGATGIMVIPAVPYLQALRLDRDELVQALGLSFTVSTVALAIMLYRGGFIAGDLTASVAVALVAVVAGMRAGQWLRKRLSAQLFRRVFFSGVGVIGAAICWRSMAA